MNAVREVVLCVCMVACAAGLIGLLVPDGPMKKLMQTVLALFLIATLTLPFLKGHAELPALTAPVAQAADGTNEALTDALRRQQVELTRARLIDGILACAEKVGVTPLEIEIKMDIEMDGRISMNMTHILLDDEDLEKAPLLIAEVRAAMGLDCSAGPASERP